jgi:glucokinase
MELGIGVDVGGTWVRAALGDRNGKILRKESKFVNARGNDSFLGQLEEMIRMVGGEDLPQVTGIGIGLAGRLDLGKGRLVFSPHSSLRDMNVSESLERRLGKSVTLLNDNVAAVLAESAIGGGVGQRDLVYVGIGTGIGGGAIIDGRILLGKEGNAHEMGHMIIDHEEKLECACGGRGHWEAYTSGSGLPNFAKLLAEKYRERTLLLDQLKDRGIVAKDVFTAARLGDEFAALVVEESAKLNAIAFANLTDLYDPSVIVVGGAVAINNKEFVVDPLKDRLAKLSFNSPPKVTVTPLGEESSLLGAILSAFPDMGARA